MALERRQEELPMADQVSPGYRAASRERRSAGLAVGLVLFAAMMMFMAGLFQAFTGLVAIVNDDFYVATQDYLFKFDQTTWGWVHLILGLVVAGAGVGLLAGRTWARAVALVVAVVSAIATFGFLPYYPLWALIILALDILVIWAIATHGSEADVGR
jgi:hypothetical protein